MGHAPADVWGYTPRQIAGFQQLAGVRKRREAAEALAVNTMAARGQPSEVKRRLKEWQSDG
jgi:hypothetical protein